MTTNVSSFPTPLTPPHTEDEKQSWLRLVRSHRVGAKTFFRLMQAHGTAEAALAALPETARAAGIENYQSCPLKLVRAEIGAGRSAGADLLCYGDPAYPAALANIPDPPPLLWCRGDPALMARRVIAIVGARNASSLGQRMARRLATDLSEAGFVIVSGLARGIDAIAHDASLEGGTIGVMAGGVDVVYPRENAALTARISERGLLLSEQPMGLEPQARHFPRRNRIVSGLGRAVVVVEASGRSGSLITAQCALDQNRDVLAVPGHPLDARAFGCNALIRDGATLVRGAEDVIEALLSEAAPALPLPEPDAPRARTRRSVAPAPAPEAPTEPARSLRQDLAALHSRILSSLSPTPVAEDQLLRDLSLPQEWVTPALVALEVNGDIVRHSGGLLSRRV